MDPNLDPQSTDDLDAGLGVPLPQDAFDLVEGDEGLQDLGRFLCRDQQVQIADGFLPAADAPCRLDGDDSRQRPHSLRQLLGHRPGDPDADAAGLPLGQTFDAGQDGGLRFGAHSRQLAQTALACGGLQLGDGRDAQLMPEAGGLLRPDPADLQNVDQARGHVVDQLFVEPEPAGRQQLLDLGCDRFADAGDLLQPPFLLKILQAPSLGTDALRRSPVGDDAVDRLALDLEQIADTLEDGSDLVVRQGRQPLGIASRAGGAGGFTIAEDRRPCGEFEDYTCRSWRTTPLAVDLREYRAGRAVISTSPAVIFSATRPPRAFSRTARPGPGAQRCTTMSRPGLSQARAAGTANRGQGLDS